MDILLVDDDAAIRKYVSAFLEDDGHNVVDVATAEEAQQIFSEHWFPMVLSDIRMPGMSGIELLEAIKKKPGGDRTDVVLFTGYGSMESAIAALRLGAYNYMLKPIEAQELYSVTQKIAERSELRETPGGMFRPKTGNKWCFVSKAMRQVEETSLKFHNNRSLAVLIEGETGTGKEVVARLIHSGGQHITEPFIDINCAALTASLFESELFGYEAGAFTGGLSRGQKGKMDLAKGGTLFLDEIGELPLELQAKLLRVIQDKEYYRVGGLNKIKADIRIICATNINLKQHVEQGTFRKDLYYRLKVGHVLLPPLRQRTEAILPLAELFLAEIAGQNKKSFRSIQPEAARILQEYPWPGNVRELRNTIEWAVCMYDDVVIKPEHLEVLRTEAGEGVEVLGCMPIIDPEKFALPLEGISLEDYIDRIVQQALAMHGSNKSAAARFLGISRRALCCRLERQQRREDVIIPTAKNFLNRVVNRRIRQSWQRKFDVYVYFASICDIRRQNSLCHLAVLCRNMNNCYYQTRGKIYQFL